jgi:site-specific DNA-methyltransferase (adenine-specific)
LTDIVKNGRNQTSGLKLFRSVGSGKAAVVNLDPQYRAILDKQSYGNEGARQKGRVELPQMSEHDIAIFVEQAERVLRPSGHLLLWIDKFTVASGAHLALFRYAPLLKFVDMIAWNKGKIGMGARARCRTEYCLVAQKEPTKAKGVWEDHSIDDSWTEYSDPSVHPHAKPLALTRRLISSVTRSGDLVVDPCAGSYGVLEVCRAIRREYLGSDLRP